MPDAAQHREQDDQDERRRADPGSITGADRGLREAIAQQKLNAQVAEMIVAARERAGLAQNKLADLAGTTQNVISRLEAASCRGWSLSLLQRIAAALNLRVEVRLVPDR